MGKNPALYCTPHPPSFLPLADTKTLSPMDLKPENCLDESEVIPHLRMGNEKALEYVFNRYHASLFFYSLQFIKSRTAAEDIVAETFIKFWDKRNDFEYIVAIKSFLFISVKNASLNLVRQSERRNDCHEEIKQQSESWEEAFDESKILKAELLQRIWEDVEQLPPIRRKIFKMIYIEGMSSLEVASTLNIAVDTVRVQKARALHTLRGIFGDRL